MGNNSAPPTQPGPSGAPATGANPLYDSSLSQQLGNFNQQQAAPGLAAMQQRLAQEDAARKAAIQAMPNPVPAPGPAYDPAHAVVSADTPAQSPQGTMAPTGSPDGDVGVKPTNSPLGSYLSPQESGLRQRQQANISNYIQSGGQVGGE